MATTKRYFVYRDALATEPADPTGEPDHLSAEQLATLLYGPGHHADIRKEYANELAVAEGW